ncbi:PepSY domain-containing protein [Streptomyces sp. NPDC048337]|uniref:PepSY domain-containing protein n=1 Tax=Streptomyces sp. NPDC048337 TaxID=3365535 RepID=UPI00371177ED
MKRNVYISAAASVVLMVGGPVAVAAAASADTARTVTAATAARADVDAQGAAAAALKKYPGVVQSLDKDGSTWHVDVISKDGRGHAELDVDAAGGAVTTRNEETEQDSAEYKALIDAKVTAEQAIKAAVADHPGKVWAVDWDDDDEGKAPYWHVKVKGTDGKDWYGAVDPTTAKVTPWKTAPDNDSDQDQDQDQDQNY